MPFTPSHIAAVLPLVRTPLAPAALVIGSMAPDLPYFVPIVSVPRDLSHSLVGVPVVDLPMGIVVLLLWALVFRAPLVDFAPTWLLERLPQPPRKSPGLGGFIRVAVLVIVSLVIGILTHLLWDSFTHPDGFFVLRVAALRAQLGPFAVSRWAQYASSVFGLVVLAIWIVRWARGTAPKPFTRIRTSFRMRLAAWVAVSSVLVLIAAGIWIHGLAQGLKPFDRVLAYDVAVVSMACTGALAVLICLAWYLLPRHPRDV